MLLFFAGFVQGSTALAGKLNRSAGGDSTVNTATYEAVTGVSAEDDKNAWDNFYKNKSDLYGKEPISFLKEHLHLITRGRALVPAMGEGRNAIYLAKNGFQVEGIDYSEIAVQKALANAKSAQVSFKAIVQDLHYFHFQENYYDLVVVCLYYDKVLLSQFKRAVKRGGYLIFYNKLDQQDSKILNKVRVPDDFAVKSGELKEGLKDFQIKEYREYKDFDTRVAAILARKP